MTSTPELTPAAAAARAELDREINSADEAVNYDGNVMLNDSLISLHLTVGLCEKAQAAGQDIGEINSGVAVEIFENPIKMASVVWAIFDDKIIAAGIEKEVAFKAMLDGAVLRGIEHAMENAIRVFFPWGHDLMNLSKLERDAKKEEATRQVMAMISGATSGSSLESSESTQDPIDMAS